MKEDGNNDNEFATHDVKWYQEFHVAGAGKIRISDSITWTCGGKEGFSIGVEWGRHGYAGGVLDKEDAIKLAKFIMRTYNLNKLEIKNS